MGKHAEWRKIAKKVRRKRIRQANAKDGHQKLLEEQQRLENSPEYQKWLREQEEMQKQYLEEEARQATLREEQWQQIEVEAQKQWQDLQKKIALAREEKMKQNMKIKLEWEMEQQRLKELQAIKEKELEEKRRLQAQRENELLDFLEKGGDTPEHLKTAMETNPGKQMCPFFQKVSACRFFDGCSRNHVRPGISRTLLISNFFSDISLETKENEHGSDSNLEFENEDTYKHYKEFFYDVAMELEKCGKIRNLRTCCNHETHLRGNVYVEYYSTREALVSYHKFNGRWYAGKRLNVEFCKFESWRNAICGLFHRHRCPKGNACNFLHVFKNPKNLYSINEEESARYSSRRRVNSDEWSQRDESWDRSPTERRNWRWSESPEHVLRKDVLDESSTSHKKNEKNSSERKKHWRDYSRSKSRDIESSRRSKRRRTRSRPRSSNSRKQTSRSSSYKRSTSPSSTRRKSKSKHRSRSRHRSKSKYRKRPKKPNDPSPETPDHKEHNPSKSPVLGVSTPSPDNTRLTRQIIEIVER